MFITIGPGNVLVADRTYNVRINDDGLVMNPTQVAALPFKTFSLNASGGSAQTVTDAGTAANAYGSFTWSYSLAITWDAPNLRYLGTLTSNVTQGSFSSSVQLVGNWTPGAGCEDVTYDYYLSGTSILGTQYKIVKFAEGDEFGTDIWTGVVAYGATQHITGIEENFCGTITVQRFDPNAGDGGQWQEITPPPGPVTPPPDGPDGPSDQPPPPDVPEPPPPGPTPPPVTPPGPPPTGGGGGDGEIIEWVKDISQTNRTQVAQNEVANELLKQIRDNTEYASERLQTIDESTQIIADDVNRRAEAEAAVSAQRPTSAAMIAAGAAAGAEVHGAMGTLTYEVPTPDIAEPAFQWSIAGTTWNFNPFDNSLIATFSEWAKTIAAWVIAYYFFRWMLDRVGRARVEVEQAPQTRGNTTVAGIGGQVTAFIGAGLITAAIFSTVTVLYGLMRDGAIGGWNISGLFTNTPFTGNITVVKNGLWVLEQFFPIATALTAMISYLTFEFQIQVATAIAAAIKRFINP